MTAPSLALAVGVALALVGCRGEGWTPPSAEPLRSSPEPSELVEWQARTTALRGLEFLKGVELRWLGRDEIGGVIAEELEYALPEDFAGDYKDAYARLGLLPRELDLYDMLLALQAEELVGLYSVPRRTLFVVEANPAQTGYDNEMIVVHELVHALQHQHFPDMVSIIQGLRRNDDVVTAMAAALEGDASLTMLGAAGEGAGRTPQSAGQLREAMLLEVEFPTGKMAEAPPLLRVSLIFPYAHGTVLAASRYAGQGNRGLDELMGEPPLSTLRVLEPDDRDPVEFIALPLADVEQALAPRGCRYGHDNVAGVLTLGVLLDQYAPGKEAETDALLGRWSGDRFAYFACPDDAAELVWLTRWDDEASAHAFARRYGEIAEAVAQAAGFAEPPEILAAGRSVWVLSRGLRQLDERLAARVEIRPYATWTQWREDGCFPESCP